MGYTCWLLGRHFHNFIVIRQRYMQRGVNEGTFKVYDVVVLVYVFLVYSLWMVELDEHLLPVSTYKQT